MSQSGLAKPSAAHQTRARCHGVDGHDSGTDFVRLERQLCENQPEASHLPVMFSRAKGSWPLPQRVWLSGREKGSSLRLDI